MTIAALQVPDWMARDDTIRLAYHEASHAIGGYLLGVPTIHVKVGRHQGVTQSLKTDDLYAEVVCDLIGMAWDASIGLESVSTQDRDQAVELLEAHGQSQSARRQALEVCMEAATTMVASERFQKLHLKLGDVLARERRMDGPQIRRILDAVDPRSPKRPRLSEPMKRRAQSFRRETHSWPPTAPVARHLHDDGTVTVYSHGRLVGSRVSEEQSQRLAAEILG